MPISILPSVAFHPSSSTASVPTPAPVPPRDGEVVVLHNLSELAANALGDRRVGFAPLNKDDFDAFVFSKQVVPIQITDGAKFAVGDVVGLTEKGVEVSFVLESGKKLLRTCPVGQNFWFDQVDEPKKPLR